MKKLIIAATAVAALTASSAFAADVTSSIGMESKSGNVCQIQTTPNVVGATRTGTATNYTIADVFDATTALSTAKTVTVTWAGTTGTAANNNLAPATYCNGLHSVSIKGTGGFMDTSLPAAGVAGFNGRLGYTSTLDWAGNAQTNTGPEVSNAQVSTADTNSLADEKYVYGSATIGAAANRGNLLLTVNTKPSTDPFLNGTYVETFTVTLSPK